MQPIKRLKTIQKKIAGETELRDEVFLRDGLRIAGFDCAIDGENLICAACVLEYPSFRMLEKKIIVKRAPMPYLPTLLAFREGPLIIEAYYNLETDPSLLIVDGHGIAHPEGCGLATYIGVELHKSTIGVAKNMLCGELSGDDIVLDGNVVGKKVVTKEHANPLFVSPGNLVTVNLAADIVRTLVCPPHKMPEPLHVAHRIADNERKRRALNPEQYVDEEQNDNSEQSFNSQESSQ